jgi:hypothetical protein
MGKLKFDGVCFDIEQKGLSFERSLHVVAMYSSFKSRAGSSAQRSLLYNDTTPSCIHNQSTAR